MNKKQILQEIRRTAEVNDGVPLGSRRFEAETGICQSDWQGKLWARWNEALDEAGFAPNQLRGAYDRTELLGKYASLAQEIGRLPSLNDLSLKHHKDVDFPDKKVFARIGSKAELVQQLLEYCRGRDGFEDVASLCAAYAPANRRTSDEARAPIEDIGFVYLIKSGRFYKIGRSNAVGRREYELAIQLPERASRVHEIRTDDPAGIEAYWHKRFEGKRKNGEWFELDAADIAAFKRRKFM